MMNTIGKRYLTIAVIGAAVVGCGGADGGGGSIGAGAKGQTPSAAQAGAKALSIADRFVAMNPQADSDMHLVARKYLNNDTEVAMFHETLAGHIMFTIGGSPLGQSVLNSDLVDGKTPSELWDLIAPGEAMPETLAQAIERSKNPAPVTEASIADNAQPAGPQFGATAPAAQTKGETLLSGGYCSNGQFWNQWGGIGSGSRDVGTYNYGWYRHPYTFNYQTQYGACPKGDVSNTGGVLNYQPPPGDTVYYWNLAPDYYAVTWAYTNYSANCGWDISCGSGLTIGGTRCTPNSVNGTGWFNSSCYNNYGSSCGDHFDWISWASNRGPYCE